MDPGASNRSGPGSAAVGALDAALPMKLDAGEACWDALPAAPGVVLFESHANEPVAVLAGGDVRALVRSRLGEPDPDASRPMTDLRPVTARLRAGRVGSAFEADLVWLRVAHDLFPEAAQVWVERHRVWRLCIDPGATPPKWIRTDRPMMELASAAAFGPIATKDAAARAAEALDDLFELCRYPAELAKAPHGTPCMYKEMGRCPAACDGSEPMHAYHARLHEAMAFAGGGDAARSALAETIEQEMTEASAGLDFERAARCKHRLESLAVLGKPAVRRMGRADRARWVFVTPTGRKGWARVFVAVGDAVALVCNTTPDAASEVVEAIGRTLETCARGGSGGAWLDGEAGSAIVGRFLLRPKRAAGDDIRWDQPAPAELAKALTRAARLKPERAAADLDEHEAAG